MQRFSLSLDDKNIITGRLSLLSELQGQSIPLLVCLHGGSYDSEYNEAIHKHSISQITELVESSVVPLHSARK